MSEDVLEGLIESFKLLPGVGLKSAQRMAFFLLADEHRDKANQILISLSSSIKNIRLCAICRNFTTDEVCSICTKKSANVLCIVRNVLDLKAIEQSNQHLGRYFVLHKYLSPIDGVYPDDIGLPLLERIVESENVREIILALSNSIEGEMTAHFIEDMFLGKDIKITRLAKGIPLGTDIEYIDNTTLGIAFANRK